MMDGAVALLANSGDRAMRCCGDSLCSAACSLVNKLLDVGEANPAVSPEGLSDGSRRWSGDAKVGHFDVPELKFDDVSAALGTKSAEPKWRSPGLRAGRGRLLTGARFDLG